MELKYKIIFSMVTMLLLVLMVSAAVNKVFTNTNQMGNSIYNVSDMNATNFHLGTNGNITYDNSTGPMWRTYINGTGSLITERV